MWCLPRASRRGRVCFKIRETTVKSFRQLGCVFNLSGKSRKMSVKLAIDDVKSGAFVRKDAVFRNWITADGSSGFKAERGRYHLYVSYACPWASRTLMMRALKGLEDVISVNVVDWLLEEKGWKFSPEKDGCTKDDIHGFTYLSEVYKLSDSTYDGRITVPVLFDKQKNLIVSNESSEIIRMLNKEFNAFCKTKEQAALDFYPDAKKEKIDGLNDWIYPQINNGVYRSGFARTQSAYDVAVREVFGGLDKAEEILSKSRYLTGSEMTEADVRLFVTLVRFDHVYHGHFKCNKRLLASYKNCWGFTRDIYQHPGIKATVNLQHIRDHYMVSHTSINPFSIVSIGPDLDFDEPTGREKMK